MAPVATPIFLISIKTTKMKKKQEEYKGSEGGSGPSACETFNNALDIAAKKQKAADEAHKKKTNSSTEGQ